MTKWPLAPTASVTGKWFTFYKNGEEVWACNAMYAAHFDLAPISSARRIDGR